MQDIITRRENLEKNIHNKEFNPDKLVIIINGNGGCGKDYLIDNLQIKSIEVESVSSITPAKRLARHIPDHNPEFKSKKNRELWHSLKVTMDEYNESSMKYLIVNFNTFIRSESSNILFMHVGEPYNIQLCKDLFEQFCPTIALWVDDVTGLNFGDDDPRFGSPKECFNKAENIVEYDETFHNSKEDRSVKHFNVFIKNIYYKYTKRVKDANKDKIPVIVSNIPKSIPAGKVPIINTDNQPIFHITTKYAGIDVSEIYNSILSIRDDIMSYTDIQSVILLVYDEYVNLAYKTLHDSLDTRKYNVLSKRIVWNYSDDCVLLREGEQLSVDLLL